VTTQEHHILRRNSDLRERPNRISSRHLSRTQRHCDKTVSGVKLKVTDLINTEQ